MKKGNAPWEELSLRKNPYKGKLIAVEGIDGSGKTTQAKELVKRLNKAGYNASYSKEPTEDVIGQFIREKILSGQYTLNPLAIQYLFNADRAMHMDKIEKLLEKGMIIVMDRCFWSSVAYAMNDMEKPLHWYNTAFSILSFYHQFVVPDITFFLRINSGEAFKRIKDSDKHKEIYDNEKALEATEKNYQLLIQEFPKEFTMINAERKIEEVTDELYKRVIDALQIQHS
ncbi:MAG TPA: dTMP kinase [Candidatus Eisenbacteria bacterium]|nr:dTMP kinase [Candidatus Eisenbacteria bacterium]